MIARIGIMAGHPVSGGGGGGTGDLDLDAWIAFIEGQGITFSSGRKTLSLTWFTAMKANGYYSKIKALHWNGWSNANGNKINVVNPVDSDAAFRATYTGSPTHGSSGIVYNGSSQNGNLYIKPNDMSQNSITIMTYLSAQAGSEVYSMGCIGVFPNLSGTLIGRQGSTNMYSGLNNSTGAVTIATARTAGLFGVSRTGSTTQKTFRDGSQIGSTDTAASQAPLNLAVYTACYNSNGSAGQRQSCTQLMTLVGDGFTDAEMASFYSDFNTFRTGW